MKGPPKEHCNIPLEYTGIEYLGEYRGQRLGKSVALVNVDVHCVIRGLSDGGHCSRTDKAELLVDVGLNCFAFIQDWERIGNSTPKRRLKYYGGAPRSHEDLVDHQQRPCCGYHFVWTPYTRELEVWALDCDEDDPRTIKLTAPTARALTMLIRRQLKAQD